MFKAVDSPYLVSFDGSFSVNVLSTSPPENAKDSKKYKKELNEIIEKMQDLQEILYAHDRHAILLIFQAMDAAGKDSTIRAVMTGINPAGCQVYSFKKPSDKELDHDYLWRTNKCLPERGRIGIFNRSYYEEVLVVRVHPELLNYQNLPDGIDLNSIWRQRFESICDVEKHLARNGTVILKFWLNVSKDEQKRRFLSRIDEQEKHWKWSSGDLKERALWDDYMHAYEEALKVTSKEWAPWYAIPADDKPYMRYCVAKIIKESLQSLDLKFPTIDEKERKNLQHAREQLLAD